MSSIKKDVIQHLDSGGKIYNKLVYFALLESGYMRKCSNRSMIALLRDGIVVEVHDRIMLKLHLLTKENP